MGDPTVFLVEVRSPDASITNGFFNPIDMFNYVSPSAWVAKLIESLTGVDPISWVTQWIAGDWESLWKFGDAMGNLAQFMQELGIEIQKGILTLDESWDGNASDAAYMYFSNLASAVSCQQTPMYNANDSYHLAATGTWQLANQLGNLIQAIADEAILAGISVAASTALASTGVGIVGSVAGYAGATLLVTRILQKINAVSKIINNGGTALLGAFGVAIDAAARSAYISDVRLPSAGFTLPQPSS